MKRIEGWEIALSRYLSDASKAPFQWGQNDCILHAANAIKAITGIDLAEQFRGAYSTEDQAYDIIEENFNGDIDGMVSAYLGEMNPNVSFARRGDVVRITHNGEKAFGVVDDTGRRIAVISKEHGLVRLPLSRADVFWRVG